jgi:hypothetical protein
VAAPVKHKKDKPTALPKPPPAETAPAKSEAPKAEPKTVEKAPAKPDAKKPVYKGTKGNLITDFPSE